MAPYRVFIFLRRMNMNTNPITPNGLKELSEELKQLKEALNEFLQHKKMGKTESGCRIKN